ncbi:MAG: hypothetical protein A2Y33_12365 [Spirochaetes bacterium GWF1_51_8]|nr:MAG: hypothetical protein A2Y33_12365 [Spirochaetes bacterium GWF1_51_8]
MADKQVNPELRAESEVYMKIAKLLQKKRDPKASAKVQEIISSAVPIEEKLARIELIDNEELLKKKKIVTSEAAGALLCTIKKPLKKNSVFIYILRDFGRIKEFGKNTGLLNASIIPPKVTIVSKEIMPFLASLQRDVAIMLPILDFVLEIGWMSLEKTDYNLIAVYKKLCEAIQRVTFTNLSSRGLLESFREVELYFLLCNYMPEYPEIIIASIRGVLRSNQKPEGKVAAATTISRRLLSQSAASQPLYHLIMAMNIAEYRKFFTLKDLILLQPQCVISNFDYDCGDDVRARIRQFVNDNSHMLDTLMREKYDIDKVRRFLREYTLRSQNSDDTERYNFDVIEDFYDTKKPGSSYRFSQDKENMALFALNFFTRFLEEFEDYLIDRVPVEDFGLVKVFDSECFGLEVNKIRNTLQKLSKIVFSCGHLNRMRYYQFKQINRETSPTPQELAAIQHIGELTDIGVDLGEKLGHLMVNHQFDSKLAVAPENIRPIEPSFISNNSFSLPYWEKKINFDGYLKGMVFRDSLSRIASLAFLAGLYFYNSHLYALLEKEKKIDQAIFDIRDRLEKVTDVITMEKLKNKYAF